MRLRGRVLAIGGSDCSGGAGIQADIKTLLAFGAHAATAITAITIQDTRGVRDAIAQPASQVAAEVACVLADPGADAIKTGMLANAGIIEALSPLLIGAGLTLVIDPVLVSSSGQALLDPPGLSALGALLAHASLITPNAPEAAALTGLAVADIGGMRRAAERLMRAGAGAVLIKGGHLPGAVLTDLLVTPAGEVPFRHRRLASRHTHGTGCTLAAALAAGLAQGLGLAAAATRAEAYLQRALAEAPGIGAGAGPLNHAATLTREPPI